MLKSKTRHFLVNLSTNIFTEGCILCRVTYKLLYQNVKGCWNILYYWGLHRVEQMAWKHIPKLRCLRIYCFLYYLVLSLEDLYRFKRELRLPRSRHLSMIWDFFQHIIMWAMFILAWDKTENNFILSNNLLFSILEIGDAEKSLSLLWIFPNRFHHQHSNHFQFEI